MADKYTNLAALTEFLSNIKTWATAIFSPKFSILSYGHSTWDDYLAAYNNKSVVYCRASSSSNPASGSQTRLAFMAYVNNAENPTECEFQYYRSVSSHSYSQQGDQVYVYKLNKNTGWSVTVRETYTKINVEKGIDYTYSSGTTKLKAKLKSETALTLDSAAATTTADRVYPVALDKSGYLAVNVPWTGGGGGGGGMELVTSPTNNDILLTDSNGQAIDSGHSLSEYQTLVASPTNNNILLTNSNGQAMDSGHALSEYQTAANLVTSINSSSTNAQYPSAKCVYDLVGDIETLLSQV